MISRLTRSCTRHGKVTKLGHFILTNGNPASFCTVPAAAAPVVADAGTSSLERKSDLVDDLQSMVSSLA